MSEYAYLEFEDALPRPMQKLQLDLSSDNLMRTMKTVELAHWDYIDNYVHSNTCYRHMKLAPFLETLLRYNNLPTSEAISYVKAYDRYKKTIPTAGVVLYCGSMFVVIRMRSSSIWSMPKGKRDDVDEQLSDTARREFQEETGIDLYDLVTDKTENQHIHKSTFYFVEADYMLKDFTGYNKNEVAEVKWVSVWDVIHNPLDYSRQTLAVAEELSERLTAVVR